MNLYCGREVPRYPGERVFGYSPLGPAFLALVLLGGAGAQAGLGWAVVAQGFGPQWLALAVIGVSLPLTLLGAQACGSAVRACFRDSNWLMRYTPSGFLIQFRSYMNHHFPDQDLTAVFIHAGEIASVRRTKVRREIPTRRNRTVTERLTYLDIRLNHTDTAALREAIAEERRREAPRVGISRTRALHYPVSLPEPDLVRLDWRGVRTRIGRALRVFGQGMRVEADQGVDLGRLDRLTDRQLEDFILNLCQSGETIKAVALIKRRYGWDTTRARRFADELVGVRKTSGKGDG